MMVMVTIRAAFTTQEQVYLSWPVLLMSASNCEQLIKYECFGSVFWFSASSPCAWWVSRGSIQMLYWGGASLIVESAYAE